MLQKLVLSNYALVDKVDLELGRGLNIFTGETGAGKSILVGAIAALLGEKAAFKAPREPSEKAIVEGIFVDCQSASIDEFLAEHDIEPYEDRSFIIRREFHPSGRSRVFVNDTPIPTPALLQFSELLVDLHGQHEHQSLLRPQTHLDFLDAFGVLNEMRVQVSTMFGEVQKLQKKLDARMFLREQKNAEKELHEFQLQEIKAVDPQIDEDDTLRQEIKLLSHAERRAELANCVYKNILEDDNSIQEILHQTLDEFEELVKIDPGLSKLLEDCRSAEVALREAALEIQSYQDEIEFDANRLEQCRLRLVDLQDIQRKYGGSQAEVLSHLETLEKSLASFESLDLEIGDLQDRLKDVQAQYSKAALALHQERRSAAKELERAVPAVLSDLGLPSTEFKVDSKFEDDEAGFVEVSGRKIKAGRDGIDQVEFLITTNVGQELAPLAKVASGGEISRIMLALKSIVAERDRIPILVFDEIDSGVSGRIAQACGRRLQKLAASHQIICITHLPQIASAGKFHFLVEKHSDSKQTVTNVRRLNSSERINAIASLLGGQKISEAHLKSAAELLGEAGNTTA